MTDKEIREWNNHIDGEFVKPKYSDHICEYVTYMIEMPEGYSKPGVTKCRICGDSPVKVTQKVTYSGPSYNELEEENTKLQYENYVLKQENHTLRELVKLFRVQVDSFLTHFQGTIDGVH